MLNNRPLVGLGICVRKNGKILLHKRKGLHAPGFWAFPGGHLEKWESFEDCALRELKEEAGNIEIKNIKHWIAVNTRFYEEDKHYVVILMVADWVSGEPKIMEPEKCECWEWCDWDNPPSPLMQGLQITKEQGLNPLIY